MFTLRPATAADIAPLDALFARSYPRLLKGAYPPSVLVTALPLIARAQPRLIASGRYLVACDRTGRILGAGGWSAGRGARAEIRHVVTDDRALRQGIGRAIVSAALGAAGAAGHRSIDCSATRNAVPFYRALGFEELGEITVPLAPGIAFPAVAMARAL